MHSNYFDWSFLLLQFAVQLGTSKKARLVKAVKVYICVYYCLTLIVYHMVVNFVGFKFLWISESSVILKND